MKNRLRATLASFGATAVLLSGGVVLTAPPAAADTQLCDKYGSLRIQGGRYIVQNNNWGDDTTQCLSVSATGFSVTTASHNRPTNGAPGSYPSVYAGCHYGNCSTGSGLPRQVRSLGSLTSRVDYTTVQAGQWDASYDVWYDPNPNPAGQNTGAEVMIWGNHRGAPQPVGSVIGTVQLAGATWNVWFGNIGWNVISYVRTGGTDSLDVNLTDFTRDAVGRGKISDAWYLTSVQFGFEPWQGQTGLGVRSFSLSG
ncbi:glycoside hydrolase [Amycolatopsis sp., V23-08]|uniref:Glycoside hydrolase n=1 Tax=Amycolatopsis heterodermiae TaxID=3110235 RepID=A0ABU5RFK6_9PSEU|nr:glycoside hydrolase [Amycolatopsis sp., V23-08]MEA5365051.1 glycoside hydrolase [Amycolatopsis sp., V23-08]